MFEAAPFDGWSLFARCGAAAVATVVMLLSGCCQASGGLGHVIEFGISERLF
jgi:hypothetical protein